MWGLIFYNYVFENYVLNLYLFCLRQPSSSENTVIQITVDQKSEFYNALDYNSIHNKTFHIR